MGSAFGDGGCVVCGGPRHIGFTHCYCCTALIRQLQLPLAPVAAMVRYRVGDRMHRRLRGYKDGPMAEARRAHADRLAAMAERWLAVHRDALVRRFGAPWDVVVTVPSSCRPAGAPVDTVVRRVPEWRPLHRPCLVRGPDRIDHLVASRTGFALLDGSGGGGRLRGRSVLVVDDSLVTGARAQSAVATLRSAEARVVGIVVLGRVLPPQVLPRSGWSEGSSGPDP